jgi:hypothetical protein
MFMNGNRENDHISYLNGKSENQSNLIWSLSYNYNNSMCKQLIRNLTICVKIEKNQMKETQVTEEKHN